MSNPYPPGSVKHALLNIHIKKEKLMSSCEDVRVKRLLEIIEERDHLRKALKKIADHETLPKGEKYVSYEQGSHGVAAFAKAALEEPSDDCEEIPAPSGSDKV